MSDHERNWIPLTDDDRIAAFESLPDMLDGFMKKWGWLNFAKEIERQCMEKNDGNLMAIVPLFDEIDSLRKSLGTAILDAERAREERNREHVRLNAEWMAKCEELRKDAERYRWLRSDDIEIKDGEREIYVVMEHLPFSEEGDMVLMTEDLDDAIDTELAKKEGA